MELPTASIRAPPVAQLVKNLPASSGDARDLGPVPGSGDPLEEKEATHSSVLAWRVHVDRGAWRAAVHGVTKGWTWLNTDTHESDTTEHTHTHTQSDTTEHTHTRVGHD